MEEADLLMDRPPGGWSALVTKEWLDERLAHEREIMDERFTRIDERFTRIDERFPGIDERFRSLEGRLDERFRAIDHQFAALDAKLDANLDVKLDGLRHELIGTMHQEFRGQTWRLITALFGAVATLGAVVAMIVAATQL